MVTGPILNKLGRYLLLGQIGEGAAGVVYEAHDPHIDRRVAVKTIRVDQLSAEFAAECESRFRAEARAAGRLQHPNIIGVYDAGRDQGMAFMVMELVSGGDLKQQLQGAGPFPFERTFEIIRDLLSALALAHEQGIVHRDVKPANLLLDGQGRIKLGDFGVARMTLAADGTLTRGSMVGTPKYMSPEQVQGALVDARTDLFAVGVVLYQLLTGVRPFEGDNDFAVMQAITLHEPPPPSQLNPAVPPGIDAVVARALAKQRDARYASADDFLADLQAVAGQVVARQAEAPQPTPAPMPAPAPIPTVDDDATRQTLPPAPTPMPLPLPPRPATRRALSLLGAGAVALALLAALVHALRPLGRPGTGLQSADAFIAWARATRDPAVDVGVKVAARFVVTSSARGFIHVAAQREGTAGLVLLHPAVGADAAVIEAGGSREVPLGATGAAAPSAGVWRIWVFVSRETRDLRSAGWQSDGAAWVQRFSDGGASVAGLGAPVCAAPPCDASFGLAETQVRVAPPLTAP